MVGAKFPFESVQANTAFFFFGKTELQSNFKNVDFQTLQGSVLLHPLKSFFFFWPIRNYAENILDFKVLLVKATQSARDSARSPPQPLFCLRRNYSAATAA